jgi:hypothetical protein
LTKFERRPIVLLPEEDDTYKVEFKSLTSESQVTQDAPKPIVNEPKKASKYCPFFMPLAHNKDESSAVSTEEKNPPETKNDANLQPQKDISKSVEQSDALVKDIEQHITTAPVLQLNSRNYANQKDRVDRSNSCQTSSESFRINEPVKNAYGYNSQSTGPDVQLNSKNYADQEDRLESINSCQTSSESFRRNEPDKNEYGYNSQSTHNESKPFSVA